MDKAYDALTPKQREMYDLMSEISEDCWCAGWMMGLEYAIWGAMRDGDLSYGMNSMEPETLEKVRALFNELGGWIVWKDDLTDDGMPIDDWGPYFVTTEDWMLHYLEIFEKKNAERAG